MAYTYNDYVADIANNKIAACKMVKLAIKRHIDDIKKSDAGQFAYYFNDKKAQQAIDFFCEQVHTKGKLARQKLKPQAWQQFIIASMYGWRRLDNNLRRFKRVYLQMARKNGKTFLASGVGLYDLITEPGAEVYSAATKRDQAAIAFNNAKNTVRYSSVLSKYITPLAHSIIFRDGKMEALSADSKMQDGLNPSCAIIDEYHAHKTDDMLNVLQSGMGARLQPLIFIITTAGHEISFPCHEEYERVCKMLRGLKGYENEQYFAMVYELDKGDDYCNSKNWIKANPNLDVEGALSTEELQGELKNAKQKASSINEFLTKRMDVWVNARDAWIEDSKWARCIRRYDENKLEGVPCFGGLDLSKRTDFTAFTLYFNIGDGKRYAKHWFYIPREQVQAKMKTDSYMIEQWIKQGYITATPGDTVDYSFLYRDIIEASKKYNIQEVRYDRNLSELLIAPLIDAGLVMVEFNQSMVYMSEPSKAFEVAVSRGLIVDNNPVMRWMVSCATIRTDANDNIKVEKPDSLRSCKRIDGVITSIMANNSLEARMQEQAISVADMVY